MISNLNFERTQKHLKYLTVLSLGLVLCLSAMPAHARQNQPGESQSAVAPQDTQPQGQPQTQPDPAMQPQQNAQPQGQPDQQAQGQGNQPAVPDTLTLPAGTVIRVRVDEWISSDRSS